MGKSPGKWIKTVILGKKSSRSSLSKDASSDKKTSITINTQSKDLGADSMVISSPVGHVINASGEHTQLEKSSSANLMHDTAENVGSTMGLNVANEEELIRLGQAATKAQAAFRGYLARRAFWALKGIIRLQALVRGHLVRRQAVATLSCMRAIVEFQALVRGQSVRHSGNGPQVPEKRTSGEPVHKERANLLQTSLKSEKLSTNAFVAKLVASSSTTMPLNLQYDPAEPNSVKNWLERWSSSHFWEPLPRRNKNLNLKSKRKPTSLQSKETETGRPKRSIRRVPASNLDKNNSSGNEKPKRTARKVSTLQAEPVHKQSHTELEKVKSNLRKISLSGVGGSKRPEVANEKLSASLDEVLVSQPPSDPKECPNEKVNDIRLIVPKQPEPESLPAPPLGDAYPPVEPPPVETNGNVENVESDGKENQKTRRRKSFPAKQDNPENISQKAPTVPSYMAATESAKAKLRAQAAAKAAEDGAENGFVRRHSLSNSTGKLSLQSPRVQKPLQANGKGGTKTNKPQISPRDDGGWKR
ncbi:IQ-domain 29 [Artemisia annua]|uniref:IQ-domain 29 n=1 Tax=Artemisia annua TaxID=35608 RepID=A0A2U1NMV6_ARTAN|nr:IQ-domain 29 [Artemisia annua]